MAESTTPVSIVHKVDKFSDVHSILSKIDNTKNVLVLFDVDETLITMQDRIVRPAADKHVDHIFSEIFLPLTDPIKEKRFGHYISQAKTALMDENIPETIKMLKDNNIKVLALTRMMPGVGKCGIIESMEDLRRDELLKVGIDFRNSDLNEPFILNLPVKNNRYAAYKDGIIYASPHGKGDVLVKFLEHAAILSPSYIDITDIYFVDNSEKYVSDIEKACRKLKLNYVGIHYVDHIVHNETFDIDFGIFQFRHFQKTNIWLDDSHHDKYKNN